MCGNVSTSCDWKVFNEKTETPLNCSEKCAEMSQLYVLKAFIEKTETKFSDKSPL